MWSYTGRDGQTCPAGDRDRLAARATRCPRFRPIEYSQVLRSGYGRETCPRVEPTLHTLPVPRYHSAIVDYMQTTCQLCLGTLGTRSVGPGLIDASLPPYQSSLLKLCCRPSNKTVPSHASLLLHPLQQHLLQDRPRPPSPNTSPFPVTYSNTYPRCSEEVCTLRFPSSPLIQHANPLLSAVGMPQLSAEELRAAEAEASYTVQQVVATAVALYLCTLSNRY